MTMVDGVQCIRVFGKKETATYCAAENIGVRSLKDGKGGKSQLIAQSATS